MKSFTFLCSTLFFIAAGSYGVYEILRPKNIGQYLDWQGYSLISSDSGWDAIYEENNSNFSSVKNLRTYCSRILISKSFEELPSATKYCVDKPTTIKGQLIKDGIFDKLIQEDDDYKLGLILFKENKEFLELVSNSLENYRAWCESNLNKKINFALLRNVKNFCLLKPYKTAEEKLNNEGLKKLNREELSSKFYEFGISELEDNVGNTLLSDISKKEEWINLKKDKEKFVNAFSNYCEKEAKRKLNEEGFYPVGYSKFRSRCANIETLKIILKKQEEIKNNPLVKEIANFEKENKCNIYFLHKNKEYFKADELIWLDIQKQKEFKNRNFYQEFKDFALSKKTIKLCQEGKEPQIKAEYGYWTGKWG